MQSNEKDKQNEEIIIQNITTGKERAFYGSKNVHFKNITIDGVEQGESAFKECRNITIDDTTIVLKYTIWHCQNLILYKTVLETNSRASLWYCNNVEITNCKLFGVKACRNCTNLVIKDSIINSDDFAWKCESIRLYNCKIEGITPLLDCTNVTLDGCQFNAKYILQYSSNINIYNTSIETKDFLWHAKNVYCKNSKLLGEYLAWYSENVIFEDCHIDSIQPLCYCKKLKLINCTMSNCNLAFEYSDVEADVRSHVDSIRNVLNGKVIVDSLGEYVQDEHVLECNGIIEVRNKSK